MIVASSDDFRDEISLILNSEGFDPVTVCNGNSCLKKLAETRPIAVIVDEDVQSGGWVIGSNIRQESGVPIIVIGSSSADDAWLKAAAYGVDHFIRKPYGHRELVARIRAVSRRHKAL